MFCLGTVIFNGLLEGFERIHGLLENLHDRNAPNIFRSGLAHDILSCLVFCHEPSIFTAHHAGKGADRHDCCKQAGRTHPPVKHKHQDQHGEKHGHGSHNVSEIVGEQGFCFRCCSIQTVAQKAGGVAVKEAQRRFHQVLHALPADIGGCTESCQVSAHQGRKVDEDAGQCEGKSHPAVPGNACCLCPVGGCGYQVTGNQPDADIGQHPQDHGDGRQTKSEEGEPFVAACIAEQHLQVVGFLFLHFANLLDHVLANNTALVLTNRKTEKLPVPVSGTGR